MAQRRGIPGRKNDSVRVMQRLLRILARLSSEWTTDAIHEELALAHGEKVTLRTIRRDLQLLQKTFPDAIILQRRGAGQSLRWSCTDGLAANRAQNLLDVLVARQ